MTDKQKLYGKLTADDLRLLVAFLPKLQEAIDELNQIINDKDELLFPSNGPQFFWHSFYEKPFPQHAKEVVNALGLTEEVQAIGESESQVESLINLADTLDVGDSSDMEGCTPEQAQLTVRPLLAMIQSLILSLRCLMIYGRYINELIAEAKNGKPHLRDKAMLNAIRIDPSVVGCPIIAARVSRAVMQNDAKFLKKISNAMTGKLSASESSNYQKMRLILQMIHETGGIQLSDKELKELFVNELNLYSDTQSTSEKNLGAFTYNFKKQKSTI